MGKKRKQQSSKGGPEPQKRSKTSHDVIAIATDAAEPAALDLALDKSPFAHDLKVNDRKREATLYELLGSADNDERIAAADALITGLVGEPGSAEPVLERHLEKRLFRGLASSRNASRVGFSLVLTEILNQLFGPKNLAQEKYPGLTFEKVLGILVDKTTSGGNVPGQEERDFFFGQLFGLQCFVEANMLFEGDPTRWGRVLDLLLGIADKKVWLRSQCAWVIVEALPQMGKAKAEETLQKLSDIGLSKTAEGVGILLRAQTLYPSIKTPAKLWKDPLAAVNMPELARVLKENVKQDTGSDAAAKLKQSNWTAQLHFVWDLLLAALVEKADGKKPDGKDHFKLFWNTVIDDGLFSKSATEGQKFRGFMIFRKFLAGVGSHQKSWIKDLFTRNLMKCLMNQAAVEDRYLHLAATKTLRAIEQAVEQSPELLVPILEALLGKDGAYNFDQRTNSKTVEKLLQWTNSDNIERIFQLLKEPVVTMKSSSPEVENFRSIYATYVLKFTTQAKPTSEGTESAEDNQKVVQIGINELASWAFSKKDTIEPEVSEKTREVFRSRLSSAFARLTKRHEDFAGLCNAVVSVDPSAVAMSTEVEQERKVAIKVLSKLMKKSKKVEGKAADASSGLAMLYTIALLQLYEGAPDAINILQDLHGCSEKIQSVESGTSELLVEILLSLVSRPSSLMRQVSQQVFEAFTSQMTEEALLLLTEPLVAEENSNGYQALFENLDDEEMVDPDDDEDDDDEEMGDDSDVEVIDDEDEMSEIGSDVEFVTLNGEGGDDDDDNDEDEDDESDQDAKPSAEEAEELANLDDALAKVLRSHRLDKDKDATESDDESDMSDSEMMELDGKLAEVFKQRKKKANKSKDKKDAKESVLNFKRRVVDLLSIYVKQEASNPVTAPAVLLPLLRLVRTTTDKPLANKATDTISDFSKALKKVRGSDENNSNSDSSENAQKKKKSDDKKDLLKLLRSIHAEAAGSENQQQQTTSSHAFARAASAASLVVAASLFARDRESIADVAAAYAETQASWALGLVRLQPSFFSDWLNWCQAQAVNSNSNKSSSSASAAAPVVEEAEKEEKTTTTSNGVVEEEKEEEEEEKTEKKKNKKDKSKKKNNNKSK